MKVCLLNDAFTPVIDGVVTVLQNYAKYMIEDFDAEVEIATPEYPGADYSALPYKVVPYKSIDTSKLTNGYRAGIPFGTEALAELAQFGPDIIHSHCPASATVIARLLREETYAPLIYTYHTKYDIDIRRAIKQKQIADETIRLMVGNIQACDEVWVVSRGAGENLKEIGFTGEYRVMPNGVDFEKGRVDDETVAKVTAGYDLPKGVPVFLFVGRLIEYKNIPLILDALKVISDQGMDFRMVFIGKGPDEEHFKETAIQYGLMRDPDGDQAGTEGPDKCIFVGPIYDRDELRAWNTRADLFLFPSTFDTNGLVVREAAACGLASVLVKDSCAAEGITDGRNGILIEENAQSLAAVLLSAGGNLDHLHRLGQHAMDEIYISWRDCVHQAYRRYEQVLALGKVGALPHHKKDFTDQLVKFTSSHMQNTDKFQKDMKKVREYFTSTIPAGMEENTEGEGKKANPLEDFIAQTEQMADYLYDFLKA